MNRTLLPFRAAGKLLNWYTSPRNMRTALPMPVPPSLLACTPKLGLTVHLYGQRQP